MAEFVQREVPQAMFSALALCSLLVSTRTASATPAEVFGWGPRAQAVAGGGATLATGHEATFTNPAELARSPEAELTIGYHSAIFSLDVEGGHTSGRFPARGVRGVLLGLTAPLRFGRQPLTFSLSSRSPSNLIVRADLPFADEPQFPLLVSRLSALDLGAGIGTTFWGVLSAGVAIRALASLSGNVEVAENEGRSRAGVATELVPEYAAVAGLSLAFADDWRVAAVFRDALLAEFDVDVRATDLGALALPELNVAGVAAYDPLQVHVEVSRALSAWTLFAAVTYERWSDSPGRLEATTSCPPTRPNCAALPPEPFDLFDTWVPRTGAVYEFAIAANARAELRAGYAYEVTPMPEQVGVENTWDNSRHVLAAGYGLRLSSPLPLSIDLAYQLHVLSARTHEKDGGVPADNAGFPAVTTRGTVQSFALGMGVAF